MNYPDILITLALVLNLVGVLFILALPHVRNAHRKELNRVKLKSMLVLTATVAAAGGRIRIDRNAAVKSYGRTVRCIDLKDGEFEFELVPQPSADE